MTTRYNYDRADYPLLQAIRMRRGVLSWGLGLTAWALLLGSTLIAEEHDNRLHWVRTGLLTAALPIAALGRLAVEDSVKAGRVLLDYEDVTDAGRQQLLWHETTDEVQPGDAIDEAAPVEMVDAWEYLSQAAQDWRTHLALLSPTDTGKSSFLYLLLGAMSRSRETVVQVVEGKGAAWAGVPEPNVMRINFRPTLENAHTVCYRLHKVLNLIQQRVDQRQWEGPQMVTVIEEYLTFSTGLKKRKGAFEPYGQELEISVEAMAAVARGGGGQLVIISQSPNAENLKFSGGIRANFRFACLGSKLGGFDAVDNMIGNHRFVNERHRDRIEAEYQTARRQLKSHRHPLVLTNLLGEWRCFPLPYLTETQLDALDIASQPVPDELIIDDGWLPGIDEIGSSDPGPGPSQSAAISRPNPATTAIEPDDEEKLNLEAIEGIIFEVLAGADEPMKAHEIKVKRRAFKSVDKDLFARILAGMTRRGELHQTDEENPRYSLPP
ncbi:hypothetical protein VB780_07250 [Leptolyngbya sp. CCNP1308]|uniref:hypothetical protein n=1 Tax=Leptolyngbya sp. CCNP1308 TaxID=3110255 RepID=UPI002B220232|nr:hypothetical protein [Leptolyngbya sp. CCNP1308]MEA5448358.1 hypothetical protein [Leptolyngbya sp. CCNP1308]